MKYKLSIFILVTINFGLIGYIAIVPKRYVVIQDMDNERPEFLWGKYYEKLYGMGFASREKDWERETEFANQNDLWFSKLKNGKHIIRIYYDFNDPKESAEFYKVMSRVDLIRPGFASDGGQWPVGTEYIEASLIKYVPRKFGGEISP